MKVKSSTTPLVVMVIILIIAIIALIVIKNIQNKPTSYEGMTEEEVFAKISEEIEESERASLAKKGERDRIEFYVSKFIGAVGEKEYTDAYGMLNENFRQQYFPTEEEFSSYMDERFPKMAAVEYTNIERNGDVYVVWLNLMNPLATGSTPKEMNFVVKEEDVGYFELSFQVDKF
jgi:hypothetical protein